MTPLATYFSKSRPNAKRSQESCKRRAVLQVPGVRALSTGLQERSILHIVRPVGSARREMPQVCFPERGWLGVDESLLPNPADVGFSPRDLDLGAPGSDVHACPTDGDIPPPAGLPPPLRPQAAPPQMGTRSAGRGENSTTRTRGPENGTSGRR